MKSISTIVIAAVVLASAYGCAAPPDERPTSKAQRIETSGGADLANANANACAHALCATGGALQASCDPCATNLCAQDPYCCAVAWDATCVGEVGSICGQSCTEPPRTPPDAGASSCAHPICATGSALTTGCDACVTQLCAKDPYCCGVEWDATCVGEVGSICGQSCN